jgi:hypothetical protein
VLFAKFLVGFVHGAPITEIGAGRSLDLHQARQHKTGDQELAAGSTAPSGLLGGTRRGRVHGHGGEEVWPVA